MTNDSASVKSSCGSIQEQLVHRPLSLYHWFQKQRNFQWANINKNYTNISVACVDGEYGNTFKGSKVLANHLIYFYQVISWFLNCVPSIISLYKGTRFSRKKGESAPWLIWSTFLASSIYSLASLSCSMNQDNLAIFSNDVPRLGWYFGRYFLHKTFTHVIHNRIK